MDKIKVLFVCVHNSARSQIAEAYLKHLAGDKFEVHSAGIDPTTINPLADVVMLEEGIDISQNKAKSVFDLYKQGMMFNYVISVCDESSAQQCPIFPGIKTKNIHWSFEDPASSKGSHKEKLEKTRNVRDKIKTSVESFIKENTNNN